MNSDPAAGTSAHTAHWHTRTRALPPLTQPGSRSYLRDSPGAGSVPPRVSRRSPAVVRTASAAAPRGAFGAHRSPLPGQPVRCRAAHRGWGGAALPPLGVCPHLRDAAGARRPERARRHLRGIGQPAQALMAPVLAATPGCGLSPRAAPALGFVSRPPPPRHGLGGSEQGGPRSRRRRAELGLPMVACPGAQAGGRAGRTGSDCVRPGDGGAGPGRGAAGAPRGCLAGE